MPENGHSLENAVRNMDIFAADVIAAGARVGNIAPITDPTPEQYALMMGGTKYQPVHDGRHPFTMVVNGKERIIEMPGLPIEEVRYLGNAGQNPYDFPRVFVDGSSWLWRYAVIFESEA